MWLDESSATIASVSSDTLSHLKSNSYARMPLDVKSLSTRGFKAFLNKAGGSQELFVQSFTWENDVMLENPGEGVGEFYPSSAGKVLIGDERVPSTPDYPTEAATDRLIPAGSRIG